MKKRQPPEDELRPEYPPEFFRDMKPNPYAGKQLLYKRTFVALDEDVSEVFQSSEAVNAVLRSAIRAMRTAAPSPSPVRPAAKKRRAS
jgi:hypothetical protein